MSSISTDMQMSLGVFVVQLPLLPNRWKEIAESQLDFSTRTDVSESVEMFYTGNQVDQIVFKTHKNGDNNVVSRCATYKSETLSNCS